MIPYQPTLGYIAFYNQQRWEVMASSSFEAHGKAVAYFKPPKSKQHMVHVHVAERETA